MWNRPRDGPAGGAYGCSPRFSSRLERGAPPPYFPPLTPSVSRSRRLEFDTFGVSPSCPARTKSCRRQWPTYVCIILNCSSVISCLSGHRSPYLWLQEFIVSTSKYREYNVMSAMLVRRFTACLLIISLLPLVNSTGKVVYSRLVYAVCLYTIIY